MIVLNWNGKDDTLECLASLSKVDYPRCRIIVVDNASSDDSVPAIKSAFPDVKVLRNRRNLGYAGGNNVGIRYALSQGYDYITLLNNDTIVSQDLFSALLRASVNIGVPAILSPLNTITHSLVKFGTQEASGRDMVFATHGLMSMTVRALMIMSKA